MAQKKATLIVRNVDLTLARKLKQRAKRNGRSLQAELSEIIENAAGSDWDVVWRSAEKIRARLAGRKHSDSAQMLREDRGR